MSLRLVKVEAPSDFAFSTPLGIVSRKDKVGEIWLYLPKGSKLLTIKHPEWGVLRDYRFSKPLESRMTYELKLKLPKPTPIIQEKHDTIVEVKTVIDTIAIPQVRKKMSLALYTLATLSLHEDGPSYGLFFALMRRHGFFIHASSNLKSIGSTEEPATKKVSRRAAASNLIIQAIHATRTTPLPLEPSTTSRMASVSSKV